MFIERGERGCTISEISDSRPRGLGIKQYNSRIKDLRKQGWNVVCVRPGFFVLRGRSDEVRTLEQVKKELEFTRSAWEIATGSARQKIEKQGKELAAIVARMEALL